VLLPEYGGHQLELGSEVRGFLANGSQLAGSFHLDRADPPTHT